MGNAVQEHVSPEAKMAPQTSIPTTSRWVWTQDLLPVPVLLLIAILSRGSAGGEEGGGGEERKEGEWKHSSGQQL